MLEVIICDGVEEFERRYKKIKGKCDVFCLTKNIELFIRCSQLYGEVTVSFLESKKNGWEYEEEVWDILDKINAVINREIIERPYIYHANYQLEGITEGARVLEMLMMQELFADLFSGYEDICIYCIYNEVYSKEIEQLYFWCRKNRQRFILDYGKTKWEFAKLRLAILTVFGWKAAEQILRPRAFFKRVTRISKLKRQIKTWSAERQERQVRADVGITKQSAREKDYNWTKPYLNGLREANIEFRFICMAEDVKKKWQSFGYEADNIQRSLQTDILNHALRDYRNNKKRVWRALKVYFEEQGKLENIEQLRLIMKSHLEYDVLETVIKDAAANEFFKTHEYKVIDLQTSVNTLSSKVCAFNAKKYNQFVKIKTPVAFPFARGFSSYEPYDDLIDWRFISKDTRIRESKGQKNTDGSKQQRYVIKNMSYSEDFLNHSFSPDSLAEDLRVVWAPSYPTMWQACYSGFLMTGLTLIDFFSNNGGSLKIKFHPNQAKTETEIFEKRVIGNSNIVIEPFEKNIRKVLAEADILITNCSLSAIDAVVERKAVISVVNEREYKLVEQHKEGIYIIKDHSELTALFQRLSEDKQYRKEWIESRVKIQELYFSQLIASEKKRQQIIDIVKQGVGKG